MDTDLAMRLMRDALAVAREGMDAGEAPIGCVLARGDGTIIARAHNEMSGSQDKIAHAEIVALRYPEVRERLRAWRDARRDEVLTQSLP